ncbi:hypothetical protein [Streptomyces sp. NPDC050121]|uniref:hypothetical protein n=1 Tax=Streptomyces sp. NPDC050121 TaxID=3365601 RepID=UPI00379C8ECC
MTALGLPAASALVIGGIIGTGVFALPSAVAPYGPISLVAFVAVPLGALAPALTFGAAVEAGAGQRRPVRIRPRGLQPELGRAESRAVAALSKGAMPPAARQRMWAPSSVTIMRVARLVSFASNRPDADAKQARQLGATEVRHDSNGDVVLRDPTGALFGLTRHA